MTVPDARLPGLDPVFHAFCAPIVTRLDPEERAEVYAMVRVVERAASARGFEMETPLRDFLDSPERDDIPDDLSTDQKAVLLSDLLIHLSHFPARSSGTGEAWDYAFRAGIPQLIIGRGPRPGRRLMTWTTAPKFETEYVDAQSLLEEVDAALATLRPFLTQRRLLLDGGLADVLAARASARRAHLNLTRAEVAAASDLEEPVVAAIEEASGADPSMATLAKLANGLKLTVSELAGVVEELPLLYDVD